jgi:hypothetical protein
VLRENAERHLSPRRVRAEAAKHRSVTARLGDLSSLFKAHMGRCANGTAAAMPLYMHEHGMNSMLRALCHKPFDRAAAQELSKFHAAAYHLRYEFGSP